MLRLPSLLGAALLAVPLCAQGSILPYLPKETAFAIAVPDLGATAARFQTMPLAKMWAEEDVQKFLSDALALAHKKFDEAVAQGKQMHAAGQLLIDPETLLQLRLTGGTLAVTHLELTQGQWGPLPKFGLLLHLDFGASAQQWFGLLQMGLGMLEMQAGGEMKKEESMVGDCKLTSYLPTGAPPGMEMALNLAMTKTGVVIGTLKSDVATVLENMQGKLPGLAATSTYKNCAQHLDAAGAEMQMFLRPGAFLDFGIDALTKAAEHEPDLAAVDIEGIGRVLDALGLRGVESVGMTASYQAGKCVWKSYVVAPAGGRKGLLAAANKNLDRSFLKWVPKDAVSVSGSTLEPMSLYDALVNAVKAYDPELGDQILAHLGQVEAQLGFSIRDDLFASIGDTTLSWQMPMSSFTAAPELAMLLKVNDQDKLLKVLKSLAGLSRGLVEIEESEKRGVKSYRLSINIDSLGMGMGMPMGIGNMMEMFMPSFSFKDGWLVGGFSASDIKRTFARMDREDDPKGDIRANKEFAALAGQLPESVQSLAFTDWKANFEAFYNMATGMLAFVPMNEDVPFDMSQLPEAATLTRHLFGSLTYSQVEGNGFSSTTISPFGPEVLIGGAAAIAAGVGVMASMRMFR